MIEVRDIVKPYEECNSCQSTLNVMVLRLAPSSSDNGILIKLCACCRADLVTIDRKWETTINIKAPNYNPCVEVALDPYQELAHEMEARVTKPVKSASINKVAETINRKVVKSCGMGGGVRPTLVDSQYPLDANVGIALVQYKSMEQLIAEFPDYFFDCYGNFNNGLAEKAGHQFSQTNGVFNHLAPSNFSRMGHTEHKAYELAHGIQDTWYFKVIDR